MMNGGTSTATSTMTKPSASLRSRMCMVAVSGKSPPSYDRSRKEFMPSDLHGRKSGNHRSPQRTVRGGFKYLQGSEGVKTKIRVKIWVHAWVRWHPKSSE